MIDRKSFFGTSRLHPFGGNLSGAQVTGMTAILDLWEARGGGDQRHLAYALATTYHETATTMQPIEEYGKGHGRPYGVPSGPWHLVYDGRGDVQLTWETNYAKGSARLNALGYKVDLERHPEQAMQPAIAAAILIIGMAEGWFTGRKLADYFGAKVDDPVGSRHIINGTDRAVLIAGYHHLFLHALTPDASVTAVIKPVPIPAKAALRRQPLKKAA